MAPLLFRRGNTTLSRAPATPRMGQVYLDVSQRVLHCLNDRARQLQSEGVPFTPADLKRQPLQTLTGEPVTAAQLPLLVSWREGRGEEATLVLQRPGGPVQYVIWSTAPLKDDAGRVAGVLGSVNCVPPEPDWQVMAGLAHDLRTPLQSLKMLLSVLQHRADLDPQLREVVQRLENSADRALLIGLDLLEWCRGPVQKGRRGQTSWFALEPFLNSLAAEHAVAARHKRLNLITQLEATRGWEVFTEPVRLGRLLSNLLANAVRYTAAGRVEFTASWQNALPGQAGPMLSVGIVDSGAGISREEQESIFQPFERGRAGKEGGESSGSGLGLAVVDRLVEELGLTLEVYSEYGRGSAFHLLLPRNLLRETPPQVPPA